MSPESNTFVFDSGPLSHFSEAGWLGLLREAVGAEEAWIPASVRTEISDGLNAHAHLRGVLDAEWLRVRGVTSVLELARLGKYTSRLLGKDQRTNLGECEVLALAETHGAVAVIDDGAARTLARENGVRVKTTISLLCDLVRADQLGLSLASTIADRLLQTQYRLPFSEGGFAAFVRQHELLPYD